MCFLVLQKQLLVSYPILCCSYGYVACMAGVKLGKGIPPSARVRSTKGASSLLPFPSTIGFAPKFPSPSIWKACFEMLCNTCKSFGDHVIHNTVFLGFGYFSSNRETLLPSKMQLHTLHFIPPQSHSNILTPHYIIKYLKLHCRGCDISVLHIHRKRDALKKIKRS